MSSTVSKPRSRLSLAGKELPGKIPKTGKSKSKGMSFGRYMDKTLKELHPDLSLSKKTVGVMDNYLMDMFERIATEAGKLAKLKGSVTLTERQIQFACQLILPGEISRLAMSSGNKAIRKYNQELANED